MPRDPRPADPRLSYLLGRLHRVLRGKLDDGMRAHGLTVAQYAALSIVGEHSGLSNAQLARRSFMSAQSANQVMQALEQRGLVRRQSDPSHGRISRAELTAQGKKVLAACERVVDGVESAMVSTLGRAQQRQLAAELRECLRALDDTYGG